MEKVNLNKLQKAGETMAKVLTNSQRVIDLILIASCGLPVAAGILLLIYCI